MSDIDIARKAKKRDIVDVAKSLGMKENDIIYFHILKLVLNVQIAFYI